jgi:RimJ/RimL family protein N-acetyltransferase
VSDHGFDNAELVTRRLSLRRPAPEDVDAIFTIHSDPRASAYNPSDGLATRSEAEELFKRWDDHWQRFGFGYAVAHERASAARVGFCGVKFMELAGREVLNLFYRFAPAAWGRGLASEAASAIVHWATTHIADFPVIARVRPENVASQRVAINSGLVRAEHLDGPGYDGPDWVYVSSWHD